MKSYVTQTSGQVVVQIHIPYVSQRKPKQEHDQQTMVGSKSDLATHFKLIFNEHWDSSISVPGVAMPVPCREHKDHR